MPHKLAVLSAVPLFRGVTPALLDEILAHCVEHTYLKGETLFLEGDPPKGLIVVWRGAVKVYKTGEGGREQILEIEGPGRSIAELPMFDGLPYPASCAAVEDTIVLQMPAATFHEFVVREPTLARSVIASLSHRLRRMVALVQEISLKAVRERLAGLLVEIAGNEETFDLPWTHQEIAARIGTVREIVSRTLGRMVQEGAIRMEGRTVTILDRSHL